MNRLRHGILVFILFACAGCVPSLYGLVEQGDGIFKQELLGDWVHANDQGRQSEWNFIRHPEEACYLLNYTDDKGNVGEFVARLTKLGKQHFLDLYPVKPQKLEEAEFGELSGFYRLHLLPVHTLMRIDRFEPTPKLSLLHINKMKEHLKSHPEALSHRRIEHSGDLLLTAPTSELREFFKSTKAELFTKPLELTQAQPRSKSVTGKHE